MRIVTHGGLFHADEVFACAVLTMIARNKGERYEIQRTRNSALFDQADAVIDVGGKYDGKKFFDHHQPAFNDRRPNSVAYSSFGLIWKHFGAELIEQLTGATGDELDQVHGMVDYRLVQPVDRVDTGDRTVTDFTISAIMSGFNGTWADDPAGQHERFFDAMSVAVKLVANSIRNCYSDVQAKDEVRTSNIIYDGQVLELRRFCPWQGYVCRELPDVKYVIFPAMTDGWHIQAVPEAPGNFKLKRPLPEEWRGLHGKEFSNVTGVDDVVFCHRSLFLAGARSYDGILALARRALHN